VVQSDSELVNAVLEGNKEAFAILVRRYERSVRAVALHILHDYHWATDVSQDAFITAYQNLPALRKPSAFGPWLMKVTRRCALDYARRRTEQPLIRPPVSVTNDRPDGQFDEDKHVLLAAVIRLPKAERQVVMLRYFAGHSVKDVADIVGRGVGTVTKQLSRAHKRLRNILERSENERPR
jgi:RNA polymerase sigma-70 factor (ECF subfamily)